MLVAASQKVMTKSWQNGNDFSSTKTIIDSSGSAFPSKPNVILFSSSDDGSKWWLLCSLLHPIIKNLNRLGVILVYICSGDETDDSSLRAGLR